jgi:Zn-dependent peptidase ImmA (M78 family)
MLFEIPAEQYAAALETCAQELLREAEVAAPPVDAVYVARRLGLDVASDGAMDVRARFVRLAGVGQGTILVADDPRPERRQWAVAHEIGESVARRVFELVGVAPVDIPPGGRERVANRLASSLLLPRQWFAADGAAVNWDLSALREIYRTASHELIARRMLEIGPRVIVTLFDQGHPKWRRTNQPGRTPPLTPHERQTWRRSFESGRFAAYDAVDLPDGIADVRCWPVHEPGWRREILRAELDGW